MKKSKHLNPNKINDADKIASNRTPEEAQRTDNFQERENTLALIMQRSEETGSHTRNIIKNIK